MAEYQRHPLARPHDVGQDFWAVNYAGPSLMDRQKYIDPRTGQVWESLEEALRFLREHTMPDITARDVNLPPGPPGEAAFRISQEVPTILPRPEGPAPVVTAVPEVSSGVPVQRDDLSNWRVNQEHELRKALEREETEPELQSIDTSMLSRLIPSAQASDLAPLPPPQISPTQIEPPEVGPSLLEPPPIPIKAKTIDLPGGKIENGELVLDESPEAWAEFINRRVEVPRVGRAEEAAPEPEGLLSNWKEELKSLNRDDILQNILGLLHPISAAEGADLSELDKYYDAISSAEFRGTTPSFIRTKHSGKKGSTAYGPLQITKSMMGTESKSIYLTKEEQDYVDRFIEQGAKFLKYGKEPGKKGYDPRYDYGGSGDLDSLEDQDLYMRVGKKLLNYYIDKYGDPKTVLDRWRYGPNEKVLTARKDDPDYWEEFKKVMGL